jgi:thiol-disulfide isomerase/thioredoxin
MAAGTALRVALSVLHAPLLNYVPHMKRSSFLVALAITFAGMYPVQAAAFTNDGKVVSCLSIKSKTIAVKGTSLTCLDGNSSIKLESITGPTLINVWGSWCPPCRAEMPLLRAAFRSGKVNIVGIDIEETSAKNGKDFAIKAGITWPNLMDPKGITKSAFGPGVPVTWFLNKNGVVTYRHIGVFKSAKQLDQEIAKYLG